MTHDKELDQAAEAHAKSEGDNGNAEISFKAGAHWQRAQAPKAPEEKPTDRLVRLVRDLSHGLNTKVDAGILEEIISLFNAGVLKLYATQPRHEFNKENLNLTVSQCIRVQFEGKEKIEALEKRVKELEREVVAEREACEALAKVNDDNLRHQLTAARTQAEALAGALDRTHTCSEGIPYDEEDCVACQALTEYRVAKGEE